MMRDMETLPVFVGLDVASVNSAAVSSTSTGRGAQCQIKNAKALTRWQKTLAMNDALRFETVQRRDRSRSLVRSGQR